MSRYVPDANVFVGWLFGHPAAEEFVGNLTTADELFAAHLTLPECTSTLCTAVFNQRLSHASAFDFLRRLLALPLRLVDSPEQFSNALELASRFQHRNAYDMQYVAIAELTNAEIVTLDRGMRHAAEAVGLPVRFLA